jgi:hypothetical protein
MNPSKITNAMYAQASSLLEQIAFVDNPSAELACRSGFVLLFEQALISFVQELEDTQEVQLCLMPWLLELDTENWLVLSLKKNISEPGHWLNDWFNQRKSVQQLKTHRSENIVSEDMIFTTNSNDHYTTYKQWLTDFLVLMNEYRELNSQY